MSEETLLRTSERTAARRCYQMWDWGTNEGWEPKSFGLGARWFGIGVHVGLAEWYKPGKKRGTHPVKTWLEYCKDEFSYMRVGEWGSPEEEMVKVQDLGEAMLTGYVEHYGRDNKWDVIQPERTGQVRIPHPLIPGAFIVTYCFTFDLVYRDLHDGKIKLGEHKTAAAIQTKHLTLDDQAGSYIPMAEAILRADGTLSPKERIEIITYNFLRKGVPTDTRPRNKAGLFLNQDGTVSKRQNTQAPLFLRHEVERTRQERKNQIKRIQDEALHMEAIRAGTLPVTKNTTRDCSFCDFFEVCELHEAGGDWEGLMTATMRKRDPYMPYRKSAS
jgi:hypothetical protein